MVAGGRALGMIQKQHCVWSVTAVPENTSKARASGFTLYHMRHSLALGPVWPPSQSPEQWTASLASHATPPSRLTATLQTRCYFYSHSHGLKTRKWQNWGLHPGVFYSRSALSCIHCPQLHNCSGHGGSDDKESACSARDLGSTPGSERSPGGGHGNPLQYSCLENSMHRGAW